VVPRQLKCFQESTAISAPILPRLREHSLAHSQRCSFLIMEQCCGPLAVEIVPEKHSDFSTYLLKRARAQSGACAMVQFPDYGTMLWSPGNRNNSRKSLRFQHLTCQESESSVWRLRRGAVSCLWNSAVFPGSRNVSRKHCDYSTSCQQSESSVWRMRRCAVS
jgi:hypothetical protein